MYKKLLFLTAILFFLAVPAFSTTTTTDVEPGERLTITGTCTDGDAVELVKAGTFYIQAILWINPTTAGDDLDLEDGSGHIVFQTKCTTADGSVAFYPRTIIRGGLYIDQLDSGTVIIFYGPDRKDR